MIQLANAPHPHPQGLGSAAAVPGRTAPLPAGRRNSHAWPFPSRYALQPAAADRPGDKSVNGDSGS